MDTSWPVVTTVRHGAVSARFHTATELTLGRARSLAAKEPVTFRWLQSMGAGDVFYDVGANVGTYTVWAAARGAEVYAFEPQAENYAQLCRNIALNGFSARAYCIALSDKPRLDALHLSSDQVGSSCHSFGAAVDHALQSREGPTQGALSLTLDMLPKMGLPLPNHIKIDVDGFEHLVIAGAEAILRSGSLKSVLIEMNPRIPEHVKLLSRMTKLGFFHDPQQVQLATRRDGPFAGVAEILFHKFSPAAQHVLDRIRDTPVIEEPFPHLYITDVFPADVYAHMRAQLPPDEDYLGLEEARGSRGYPERTICYGEKSVFWRDLLRFMTSGAMRQALGGKFGVNGLSDESFLMRDRTGFAIGPHTDSIKKALSALFYLPADDSLAAHGTSIYVPDDPEFRCAGGPHYQFDGFTKVRTMPFVPNALFAFPKSDQSFHGVEKFDNPGVRDILLYDIRAS